VSGLTGDVIVVIGAGQIGQAIARRVSAGKHVLLADLRKGNAEEAAEVLANAWPGRPRRVTAACRRALAESAILRQFRPL
jgi:NAD(P)-dependent dehydrogenase (short-subunit alcohol dehydrogenase family)